MTYETQKNGTFFSVLFSRTEKNAKNATFFCKNRKEHKECNILLQRMEKNARMFLSFAKECENVLFFFYIYIEIYRYIYKYISKKERNVV